MKDNYGMMMDFYELTMNNGMFEEGIVDDYVTFDIFFRRYPFGGGYAIMGGVDNIIDYIKNLRFSDSDIEYLRDNFNLNDRYLEYLRNYKFNGDVYAIPDGTPIFAGEPVITVRAPFIVATILETTLLSEFNHGTLVSTSAKRIVNASDGRGVMEFGSRRARGKESAVEVAKYAYVAGCVGTSNTLAGKLYGIPVMGTMAHSSIQYFDDEYKAFMVYAKANPDNCVFLVDTYDVLNSGIPNAIRVARDYLIPNGYKFKGIRIDSGDLAYLSKEARRMLDEAGFSDTKICLSNGLDEKTISSLLNQGVCCDSLGVGDNIAASKERVDGVYKLVAVNGVPRIKVSEDVGKIINPGDKRVYRFYDKDTGYALGDVVALSSEVISKDRYVLINPRDPWKRKEINNYRVRELQEAIFINGEYVYREPNIHERREYCAREFETIYPEVKRLENPHSYYVDLSEELLNLKNDMIMEKTKAKRRVRIR